MTETTTPPHPGVKFPPPFLYLLGIAIAWVLETKVTRIRLVGGSASTTPIEIFGVILLAVGFIIVFWGIYTFARVKTGIIPLRPATQIVDHGPYRFTRNPMYTGMATAYLGGALILNFGWALLLFPLVMIAVYNLVIKREERYLSAVFPTEYGEYKKRVRRWI